MEDAKLAQFVNSWFNSNIVANHKLLIEHLEALEGTLEKYASMAAGETNPNPPDQKPIPLQVIEECSKVSFHALSIATMLGLRHNPANQNIPTGSGTDGSTIITPGQNQAKPH